MHPVPAIPISLLGSCIAWVQMSQPSQGSQEQELQEQEVEEQGFQEQVLGAALPCHVPQAPGGPQVLMGELRREVPPLPRPLHHVLGSQAQSP